jgi:hypothetical protein
MFVVMQVDGAAMHMPVTQDLTKSLAAAACLWSDYSLALAVLSRDDSELFMVLRAYVSSCSDRFMRHLMMLSYINKLENKLENKPAAIMAECRERVRAALIKDVRIRKSIPYFKLLR